MLHGSRSENRWELERLMERYGDGLLRMAALYLKDADLAQDAVQETFIKAYRRLGEYRAEGSEKAWLAAICINVCRDALRSAWFRRRSPAALDSLPEQAVDFTFPDSAVLDAVRRLPAKYREVVLLRYYEGLKLKEVAGALRTSEGRVRSRLRRANGLLRDSLKEWYYDEES